MYELTRRWVRDGHRVTVVTSPYEKSDIQSTGFITRTVIDGIDLIVIDSADSNRDPVWKRAWKALVFALTSCWFALREPCDLVLSSSGPITVGIPGLLAKWFRGKPLVFEIRDLWPQGAVELGKLRGLSKRLAFWFESLCYRNSKLVVACSPGMEASVNERFPKIPTLVISNASDPELFRRLETRSFEVPDELKDKRIFLYAGSLGLMDDCMLIVQAMKKVNDPDIHFVFIGEGAEREDLEREVQGSGLQDRVHFLGLLPKYDVVNWFSRAIASCVVFKNYPVLHTSSPNKLFDSFAAGIPVIQNTEGWMKPLVEKEHCGINVPPHGVEEMAIAMEFLAKDKRKREELSANATRLGEEIFNRERLARIYLDALIDIQNG